jgi:FAD/FMN-containing dehydrogenase
MGTNLGPSGHLSSLGADQLATTVASRLGRRGVAVSTSHEHCRAAGTDWTGAFTGPVLAVAAPRDTDQVADCLSVAAGLGVPVQIQGGNTGLVGGSVPAPGQPALVLSTRGMTALGPVDRGTRRVRVGAGVTCADVAAAASGAGLRFGVDLAARDSATVGGMVATNAGGINVCAYGMMRAQVRGVSAVLADGSVVDTIGRPDKDNTGYDLGGLLVGSEGTLGVVVAVELELHPRPAAATVAAIGVTDLTTAVDLARRVVASGSLLLAAEAVDAAGITRASSLFDLRSPGADAPWWLILEVADGGNGSGLEAVGDLDPTVALSAPDRAQLWALRERQTLAYAALGLPLAKYDVAVRSDRLDELAAGLAARLPGTAGVSGYGLFGHVLDGNLHVQIWGPDPGNAAVSRAVLGLVSQLGGSISAEHGIGRAKACYLHLSRTAPQIAAMRAIRTALDPAGLLNPGVLLG